MVGYINNTLSVAHMADPDIRNEFLLEQMITSSGLRVSSCRSVLPSGSFTITIYTLLQTFVSLHPEANRYCKGHISCEYCFSLQR